MTSWRRITLAALVALGLAAQGAPAGAAGVETAWRTWVDDAGGFAIEFPRGWTIAKDPFQILVATSPREASDDDFRETIKIVATDVAPGVALDGYYRNSLEVYRSIWKVHAAGLGDVGGVRARRVTLDQTIGAAKARLLKAFLVGQGRVFVITCASDPATFDQHVPVFEAALATFRILPRASAASPP